MLRFFTACISKQAHSDVMFGYSSNYYQYDHNSEPNQLSFMKLEFFCGIDFKFEASKFSVSIVLVCMT